MARTVRVMQRRRVHRRDPAEHAGIVALEHLGGIEPGHQRQQAAPGLADFKVPQYVCVASVALPRNAGGKLVKARLRESVEWGGPLR